MQLVATNNPPDRTFSQVQVRPLATMTKFSTVDLAVADTTGKPTGLFHKFPFHKRATICRTRNSKKVFTVKDNSKLNTPSHQKIDNKHLSPRLALIKITRDIVQTFDN